MGRRRRGQRRVTCEDRRERARRTKAPKGNENYPLGIPPEPLCGERGQLGTSLLLSAGHTTTKPGDFRATFLTRSLPSDLLVNHPFAVSGKEQLNLF